MPGTKKLVGVVALSVALTPIVSACDGGGGSCGKVQPCGGDVVGDWNIVGACITSAALENFDIGLDCPTATSSVTGLNVSGSASFNADLTYTRTQTLSATVQLTIPMSCLMVEGGITLTCAQFDQGLQQALAMQPGLYQSAHCAGSTTCSCTFILSPQTRSESGTYTTSGTTLTTTSSTGATDADQYCVQGNELHIPEFDMTMPMGAIQADTVLTRR
jgi:hypothetical protein